MPKRKSSCSIERKSKLKKEDKKLSENEGKNLSKALDKKKKATAPKTKIKLEEIDYVRKTHSLEGSLNTIKSYQKDQLLEKTIQSEVIGHWENDVYIASSQSISIATARNVIQLFDEGSTIPFIARYRKNLVGDLEPSKLREIKAAYEGIKKVRFKAEKIIFQMISNDSLTISTLNSIKAAQTVEELDFIAAPLKKNRKESLAHHVKESNLEEVGIQILEGTDIVCLESFIQPNNDQLNNIQNIKSAIQYIVAHIISKNVEIQSIVSKIVESGSAILKVEETKSSHKTEKTNKYDIYKGFSQTVRIIKPYQILAINRGEAEGELSSKIIIKPDELVKLKLFCKKKWLEKGHHYELRQIIITAGINDAIKKLLCPFIKRRIRAKLKMDAEKEAINIFGANLKQLLLTPPYKGKIIMGIDPGFRHGCKVAVISLQGVPLKWDKFFLPRNTAEKKKFQQCESILKNLILTFECETIALGNGTGCRETETLLVELIENNSFKPLNVSYTIISEQGVSVYSCSREAAEEFPNLDIMFVGAVSLARRLQDPLSELVKVEPKHLGVGLYQHDLKNNKLNDTLNEIVTECVSFVGVDINTSSFYLLKRVAGLNAAKAQEIIKYRNKNTSFGNLEELKKVKGIKDKTFLQCAGFLRITSASAGWKINPLDQTAIHPESYATAKMIANKLEIDLNKIGTDEFIKCAKANFNHFNVATWAKEFGVSSIDVCYILENFTNPTDYDMRKGFSGPIFRKDITKLSELKVGLIVTGKVKNVVPFGVFVDIGVPIDGLIHSSKIGGETLNINDNVSAEICSLNLSQKKIALKLVRKI